MLWPRAIILVDMNAFFASVEQRDHPELRGHPVAITNGTQGTCIITCSYEARAYGIKTGMRLPEAKRRCPHLIQVPAHPHKYGAISEKIMDALATLSPMTEVFSVDECFLDVTACQRLWGSPEIIGELAQKKVWDASGLPCSVGVSGDKTTAKYAAKVHKPNGFTVIPPWEAKTCLKNVPVTELCGIAKGIARFLAQYGVYTCGDMEKVPISILSKRFGNFGRRMWFMCQGEDPEPVHTETRYPKSMGHGKVMPPNTRDKKILLVYLRHMCEKLAARLRRHDMEAQDFFIGWRHQQGDWLGKKTKLISATHDGKIIYELGQHVLNDVWQNDPVCQIQVTALHPHPVYHQQDLFEVRDKKRELLNVVTDDINARYGEFALAPATILTRSSMPNVISPAWKPKGLRQTI